ncbi:MAG: hypothetical protein R3E13_09940 [Alphaproteobacteria bacterium]
MSSLTAPNAEFTIKTIEGRIKGLAATLYKLAAHPGNPDHRGPLFISLNSAFKPAADYDGMGGSFMLEGFLSGAFAEASNDNGGAAAGALSDFGHFDIFAEALSEYAEYSEEQKRGKGTYALGEHQTICNQFNNEKDHAVSVYARDLKKRMNIEAAIAKLSRELCAFKNQKALSTPALYAHL